VRREVNVAVFREGTNPIWGAFMLTFVLGALGLDFYWLFTESGLIGWLAEVEASVLGGQWLPKITLLIVFLGQIAVLLVLKVIIELITGRSLTGEPPKQQ
jgi:hypothetical protein